MQRNRREFFRISALGVSLGALAGSSASANQKPLPKESEALAKALVELRKKTGLKIVRIESFVRATNIGFVRIRTDDGSEGVGQLSPFDADITATILHRKIAPHVLGADPGDFVELSQTCIEKNYKYPWSFVCRALTGVDTAIWDLLGKKHKKSVCGLLGTKPRPITVYGSSMSRQIKPAEEAKRLAKLRDEKGFTAFKIRIGKVNGHDQDQWPGRTDEIVPAVRKAIGEKVKLLVDANSCYTPKKAIQVGKLLEENKVCHFEEPCPYWELEWTAEVAAALTVPVAGGEQDNDLAQWRRMIRLKAVDVVQPDVCYVGGVTRVLQVSEMAARAGVVCVPHSANLSMVTLFTLHMMAAIPNAGDYVEFSIEDTAWTKELYAPALEVRDGKVAVPAGPGWGVEVNKAWLEKATRQVSERK